MAESSLKQRLQDHAKSFDGLLSLIPAKIYYGGDNSDQWKKKKQSKAEANAALRAKLDPDSFKTAKDVMDENARKRKLDETDDDSDIEGVEKEMPRQGLREGEKKKKKQKKVTATSEELESASTDVDHSEAKAAAAAEKKRDKAEKQKEKLARKAEKKRGKKGNASASKVVLEAEDRSENEANGEEAPAENEGSTNFVDSDNEEMNPISVEGLVEGQDAWSTTSSSPVDTTVFDKSNEQSANTSTSSVIPPAKAPKNIKPLVDPEILRKRLADRIEQLRAARKADGPARNRSELIESRRKKEEQRRAHRKELRRKAAAEEAQRREEALASARNSPASSMMGGMRHSPENNFSFGRVAFADGQQLTNDLSSLIPAPKKKGPQDAGTALQVAEKKRQKLAGLDDEKKADIEEKDLWLNAKKRAHGERVRDDTSLLKKTLKRKEKQKRKSEKEWVERQEGVAKSISAKQKKREENLQNRKDGKGGKAKGGKPGSKGKKPKKPMSRPGFEGSFTSKKR